MSSPLPCRNNLVKLFPGCYSVGNLSKVTLNHRQLAELNEVIPGVAVDIQQSHSFKKILFQKKFHYSMACTKVKKRNSYTVSYIDNNGLKKMGEIALFLKIVVKDKVCHFLAAVHEMIHCPQEAITNSIVLSTISAELGKG